MPQLEQQEGLVLNIANMKSPLFEESDSQHHSIDKSSAQNEAAKNDSAKHQAISMGELVPRRCTTDSPKTVQAATLPEGLSETDWTVFDKEAADSDKGAIENISTGDFQIRDETPKPAISLAQQDYELQLRLLEAQNKKRLEMARQEQSKRNIQPSQMQVNMKRPPESVAMGVRGPMRRIPTSGNAMATLPPGAPYFMPGLKQIPDNSMAMNANSMATIGGQPIGRYNPEDSGNANANADGFLKTTLPMSPNQSDTAVLLLQRQLKELQVTNQALHQQLKHARGVNFVVFHCIPGQEGEGVYLDKPYWVKSGENFQPKADFPVRYPDAYILYKPLAFVVYKYYSMDIPTETIEALQQGGTLLDPEPNNEIIKLVSEEMIEATKAFAKRYDEVQKKLSCLSVKNEMRAPYPWWYYYRDHRNIIYDLPKPHAELIYLLTNWIDINYNDLYSQTDSQFKRGMVSAASLSFLIQPGDVLVRNGSEGVEACLATSWLHKEKRNSEMQEILKDPDWTLLPVPLPKKSEWMWEVDARPYGYDGDFDQLMRRLSINLDADTADTEIPIANLDVFPLRFASPELRETLERRGKTF